MTVSEDGTSAPSLRHLALINDNSVIKVTTLDETQVKQRLQLAHEYECTARCNLTLEVLHVFECSILVVEEVAVIVYKHVQAESLVGEDDD